MDVGRFLRGTESDLGLASAAEWVDAASGNFASCDLKEFLPEHWEDSLFVFRGQKNADWGLKPSLHRTVAVDGERITENRLGRAERAVIEAARRGVGSSANGDSLGSQLGLNLTDGQLLAVLQHQESPTRFLDVSLSGLVALFFACEKEDQVDGRVFVVALESDPESGGPASNYEDARPWLRLDAAQDLPWPEVEARVYGKGSWTTSVCLVDAGGLDPRMSAQEGVFLVGGLARSYGGMTHYWSEERRGLYSKEIEAVTSLQIHHVTGRKRRLKEPFPAFARTLRVPASMKRDIRNLLSSECGIAEGSVYPDFAGFRRLAHKIAADAVR